MRPAGFAVAGFADGFFAPMIIRPEPGGGVMVVGMALPRAILTQKALSVACRSAISRA